MSTALEQIHDYGVDFVKRAIYLMGSEDYAGSERGDAGVDDDPGVEFSMANRFIKNLTMLQSRTDAPITVHMKTHGGHYDQGMAIYGAIKSCPNHITIINYAEARSMSSIIFQAADERIMLPHTRFMFHGGTEAMSGTYRSVQTAAALSRELFEEMLEIYIESMVYRGEFANKPRPYIRRWLIRQMERHEEVYLNAHDTVRYGFADRVRLYK